MRSFISPALTLSALVLTFSSAAAQQQMAPDALRPGDVIRVTISGEPDLSGEFAVDETGHASLPLIGNRPATGIAAGELRRQILAELNTQFHSTAIQVTILRRITVLGQVRNPGLYLIDTTMTVGDVIAQAGGATDQGQMDEVRIVRNGQEIRADLTSTQRLPPELRSGDQLFVPGQGWFAQSGKYVLGIGVTAALIIIRRSF